MKKVYVSILAAVIPAMSFAQSAIDVSAIDAYTLGHSELRGTARFMSMGGAFTALGGDLSTLNQNPAGIGVYRSSEVGATLDINFQSTKTDPSFAGFPFKESQTKAYCNNFGYVGTAYLGGSMPTFSWGVTYNRTASFDRIYSGYNPSTNVSLSDYIASFTTNAGVNFKDMDFGSGENGYNPYLDSDPSIDWLSILAYSSWMINPTGNNTYQGLSGNGTVGDAMFNVRERGNIDEYNISFGGNIENIVNWGISFGITDLDYTRLTYYSESMENALIPNASNGQTRGDAGFELTNYKHISGSGWNIKAGVIIKPINEFRIGLAVHTPTWYRLDQSFDANVNYSYYNPALAEDRSNPLTGNEYTENGFYPWRLNAPWKLMVGAAGVIGSQAIVSLDYEYDAYGSMKVKRPYLDYYGYISSFESDEYANEDISNYYKGSSIIRLGIEYRVTPQFSLRAGYNYQTSNTKNDAYENKMEIYTNGTDPSYTFDKDIYSVSFGLGYKYKSWYIDAAYVYRHRESKFSAFTSYDTFKSPSWKVQDSNSSIILSTGFKF